MKKLISKIQDSALDMMKNVKYEDKTHTYYSTETGEWFQGVSTVSSIVPKDWLSAWGAKEAVKALGYSDYEGDTETAKEVMKQIKNMKTPEEYILFLKNAKGASGRKSKTALVDGKAGHEWLETYVKAKIRNTKLPAMPKGSLERPINQFLEWEQKNVKQWILSEARVSNVSKKYAGTLDAVAILEDWSLSLIDFKFSSHISEDYLLQTAGYQACFEPYNIEFDSRVIIRLPKTLEKEEWDKETMKYRMVANDIEVMMLDKGYEEDRDAFYHALPLKRWINKFTK